MKFALSFFSLLLLLTAGVLFFQYQTYSTNLEEGNGPFTYSQEIEVIYKDNSLDIRQHFKNLPSQTIEIKWPEKAVNPSCLIDSKSSCKRLSEDFTTFKKGEARSQSVSYIIPLEGGLQSPELIQNVFAQLNNGEVSYTTVHISTDSAIAGQWVTGLPLVGQQSLSLVNYAMFSGEGQVNDLYWQKGNLAMQFENDIVSIYAPTALSAELQKGIEEIRFLNKEHISIVQGQNNNTNRMLFLPNLSVASIEKEVILSQVLSQYTFKDSPDWLPAFVASYFVKSDIAPQKANAVKEQLSNYLTANQAKEWKAVLEDLQGKTVSPKILDKHLSKIIEAKTSYFQLNAEYKEGVYPILLEDTRSVYVDEIPQEDVRAILQEGQILYTADPLFKALGYEVTVGDNGYYVKNGTRSFRFTQGYGFYVFNQRRYNTISEPIVKIANQYYIEEAWLSRLFLVELKKADKRIDITSMAMDK